MTFEFRFMKADQQYEVQVDEISFSQLFKSITGFISRHVRKIWKSFVGIFVSGLKYEEKFLQVRSDPNYILYMDVQVWEQNEVAYLYFLYVNPIFLLSAQSSGWLTIVIDFTLLVVIEMLTEKMRSQVTNVLLL